MSYITLAAIRKMDISLAGDKPSCDQLKKTLVSGGCKITEEWHPEEAALPPDGFGKSKVIVTGTFSGETVAKLEQRGVTVWATIDGAIPAGGPFQWAWDKQDVFELIKMLDDYESIEMLLIQHTQRRNSDYLYCSVSPYHQYRHPLCRPVDGDVVLDVGAWVGDTARWFCSWANDLRVYCFEPTKESLKELRKNTSSVMGSNNRVKTVQAAAGKDYGKLSMKSNANGSHGNKATNDAGDFVAESVPIGRWCHANGVIPSLIKVDAEGMDLDALEGASGIIRSCLPRLQISLYHKTKDIVEIPRYIKSLVPEYKMYLGHHKFGPAETVLYCVVPEVK